MRPSASNNRTENDRVNGALRHFSWIAAVACAVAFIVLGRDYAWLFLLALFGILFALVHAKVGGLLPAFAITLGCIAYLMFMGMPRRQSVIRPRVATVEAEHRNLAAALESFHHFEGRYPTVREFYDGSHLGHGIPADVPAATMTLSSPISYIAAMTGDPFSDPPRHYHYYHFSDGTTGWILGSVGPDRKVDFFSGPEGHFENERAFIHGIPGVASPCSPRFFTPLERGGAPGMIDCIYDPTNGIVSRGDIIKTGP